METKKKCTKCSEIKKLEDFSKKKNGKFGRNGQCKVCRKNYFKELKERNLDNYLNKHKKYRSKNKKKILEKQRKRNNDNRDEFNKYHRDYRSKRRSEDILFKLSDNIRTLIGNSLRNRGFSKKSKVSKILGCSYEELNAHLNDSFENRYGIKLEETSESVHIDHITPLSTAKNENDLLTLNHYSNLQYLYASENLEKSDKLDWE